MNELVLGLISFFTSAITGVVGLGGGLLLIAILPSFLPLNALIPVHGLSQKYQAMYQEPILDIKIFNTVLYQNS